MIGLAGDCPDDLRLYGWWLFSFVQGNRGAARRLEADGIRLPYTFDNSTRTGL